MRASSLFLTLSLLGCPDQKVGVYNAPPVVSITSPPDGSSYDEGDMVDFTGLVSDSGTAPDALAIQWSSDIDGTLTETDPADSSGIALYSTGSLSVGNHSITLAATDEQGERTIYSIGVTIVEVPDNPELTIVHPTGGEYGEEGESFEFVVTVSDEQQEPDTLTITMSSDIDGTFCTPTADSIGVATCDQTLSAGDHRLTFRVVDADGLAVSEDYYFTVISGDAIDNDGDGYTETQGDCDDGDASVSPFASEYYNDRDDDCDGIIDDGTVGYDDDRDGQSELDGDCDDANVGTYDGATEVCDGLDNDCDTVLDEDTTCSDDDGDGWTELDGDCNDESAISYPAAVEVEDADDNDCDGIVDEGTNAYDDDFDGYTENDGDCDDGDAAINPAGTESCDGYDNNCDGTTDEENASGCFTYYYDYDGDGYGSSSVSGECLCSFDGYYTSANANDCYDYNASASPAATSYSASQRGDGSYDWNCDGSATQYYTASGDCSWTFWSCTTTNGWESSTPACGSTGNWVGSCSTCGTFGTSCCESTSTLSQLCL